MLKRINRLSSNFEFNVARKYGQHLEGNLSHIYFLIPKNYEGPVKVGIVVSTKIDKRAVVRNRIKRLYREAIKDNFDKIKDRNLWIAIHPKFSSIGKTYEEIASEVNQAIQKASLSN